MCGYAHVGTDVHRGQKRVLDSGVGIIVNHPKWVLGTELSSSVRAACVPNHQTQVSASNSSINSEYLSFLLTHICQYSWSVGGEFMSTADFLCPSKNIGYRQEDALWWWRQRLEGCRHKPRYTLVGPWNHKGQARVLPWSPQRERSPASLQNWEEEGPVVLSCLVCGGLSQWS